MEGYHLGQTIVNLLRHARLRLGKEENRPAYFLSNNIVVVVRERALWAGVVM